MRRRDVVEVFVKRQASDRARDCHKEALKEHKISSCLFAPFCGDQDLNHLHRISVFQGFSVCGELGDWRWRGVPRASPAATKHLFNVCLYLCVDLALLAGADDEDD